METTIGPEITPQELDSYLAENMTEKYDLVKTLIKLGPDNLNPDILK